MKNNYKIIGDKVRIYLNKNKSTIVSKQDFEKVSSIDGTWYAHKNKDSKNFYVRTCINIENKRVNIKLHRFLFDLKDPSMVVHHVNNKTLDNTRENLKSCTRKEHFEYTKIAKDDLISYQVRKEIKISKQKLIELIRSTS